MNIDFSDLIAKLPAINDMVGRKVQNLTNKVAADVHARVVQASPVDTGAFRGTWQLEPANAPYQNATVTNATPYGPFLVDGHSRQAPSGWLDNAVQAAAIIGGGE